MWKTTFGFSIVFVSMIFAEPPNLTSKMERFITAQAAAQAAMQTFSGLVDDQNFKQLGFENPDQINNARLGSPIRRFFVRLDALRKYESGKLPQDLLQETKEIVFPVEVNNAPRSSLTISGGAGKWTATSFGGTNYIRTLSGIRQQLAKEESQPLEAYIEVQIPALNFTFLGRESDGKLILTPVYSVPRFGFEAGKPLSADQVFNKLVPTARKHKDLPS